MKKLALALAFLLPALASAAGLTGTTVDVRYDFENGAQVFHTLDSVLVGAGTELSCPGAAQICQALTAPTQSLDFGNSSIRYDYSGTGSSFNSIPVNGFTFQSLFDAGTVITGVTLTGSGVTGLDASRVSFSAHTVQVYMGGVSVSGPQASFQLDIQTAPVPEPASAALLLGGLALLAVGRRR
ncbi:PEP-CTERM sorting domain-containing protein [Roseateles sp. NT4]|uniref:PEP-CTERM sorting domain-containing protein n=1 Tax=Roseateles sp. NT4 TaxID=3453715 RepID=UPI003EEE5E0C